MRKYVDYKVLEISKSGEALKILSVALRVYDLNPLCKPPEYGFFFLMPSGIFHRLLQIGRFFKVEFYDYIDDTYREEKILSSLRHLK